MFYVYVNWDTNFNSNFTLTNSPSNECSEKGEKISFNSYSETINSNDFSENLSIPVVKDRFRTNESSSYPTSTIFNDQSIDETISKMSIEDKCGQMTQITIDTITKCPPGCDSFTSDGTPSACSCPLIDDTNPLNLTKLEEAIQKYRVGSILNTAYDRAQKASIWQDIINQIQKTASDTELKIPILYGLDSIHGANYIQEATLFPQPLAMAASFNIDIAKRVGAITAMETRAVGVPWNFNPVLDIGRQHLWPR